MLIGYYAAIAGFPQEWHEFFAIEQFTAHKDRNALRASVSGNGRKKGALSSGEKLAR
jgi:hypothetical protein